MSIVLLLFILASPSHTDDPVRHGRALASELCGRCHAVGLGDRSPRAGALPLREIGRTVDLDSLPRRLQRGLAGIHPDMPEFRFNVEDARAFRDYLRAIQR
jgi:hypothetical protein